MGNKNRSKNKNEEIVVEETVVENEVETEVEVEETVVENEVETEVEENEVEVEVEPEVEETEENEVEEESEVEEENVKMIGIVTGCAKLNVRKEPSKQSDVLCIIDKNTEVEIDTEEETTYEDFYKIVTSTGVKGYCVKSFIEIK